MAAQIQVAGNVQRTKQEATDSFVVGRTSLGVELRAGLLRLTRYSAVIEIYNPALVLRTSEVLDNFRIVFQDRTVYSGQATVRNIMEAGLMAVCEIKLRENSWTDVELSSGISQNGHLGTQFNQFMEEWQKLYRVLPDFKLVVADMQSFLSDLRLWLEQVELNVRSQPDGSREEFERHVLNGLREPVLSSLGSLFERFEEVAARIEPDLQAAHSLYAKRQLHPLVLCAPFMYRTFQKPLGYAGDYEVVNMMVRDSFQGGSVFAKILNTFFLNTPPVVAHRNRIELLFKLLVQEGGLASQRGKVLRVLNLGCGPAHEVQRLFRESHLADCMQFTFVDFNAETLAYVQGALEDAKRQYQRRTPINFIRKSVHQILKEAGREIQGARGQPYDYIYCAGLFDYLSNPVCQKLTGIFYNMLAPGGAVVITNVDPGNPSRGWMEHVVDWHLFYRTSRELTSIVPKEASPDDVRVLAESSGVNTFVRIEKPANA